MKHESPENIFNFLKQRLIQIHVDKCDQPQDYYQRIPHTAIAITKIRKVSCGTKISNRQIMQFMEIM